MRVLCAFLFVAIAGLMPPAQADVRLGLHGTIDLGNNIYLTISSPHRLYRHPSPYRYRYKLHRDDYAPRHRGRGYHRGNQRSDGHTFYRQRHYHRYPGHIIIRHGHRHQRRGSGHLYYRYR